MCPRGLVVFQEEVVSRTIFIIAVLLLSNSLLVAQNARISVAEIESVAQQNNPEIRAAARRS